MAAYDAQNNTQVMDMMYQFNIDLNSIIMSKTPQFAEAIARSPNANQATVNDIVNRILDKMLDATTKKFAKYGVVGQEDSTDQSSQNTGNNNSSPMVEQNQAPAKAAATSSNYGGSVHNNS